MLTKFTWINRDKLFGEVYVSESNKEELARLFTRFKHYMSSQWLQGVVEETEGKEDSARFSVYALYVDNDYHLNNFGTREEYTVKIEDAAKRFLLNTDFSRDTNTSLMNAIVEEIKKEGLYNRFKAIEEYYLPESHDVAVLTRYEFDIISYVNYGSEGTWLNCYLSGVFDEGKERRINLGTFKTLKEDLDASLIMGELGGAVAYLGSRYVNRNIDRYSPSTERKE